MNTLLLWSRLSAKLRMTIQQVAGRFAERGQSAETHFH